MTDAKHVAAWLSWLEHAVHTRRVVGSNPTAATTHGPLVKRLRHRPFTAATGVRIPYGSPPRALSSAGGAPALQAGGHRFEPYSAHQKDCTRVQSFFYTAKPIELKQLLCKRRSFSFTRPCFLHPFSTNIGLGKLQLDLTVLT